MDISFNLPESVSGNNSGEVSPSFSGDPSMMFECNYDSDQIETLISKLDEVNNHLTDNFEASFRITNQLDLIFAFLIACVITSVFYIVLNKFVR